MVCVTVCVPGLHGSFNCVCPQFTWFCLTMCVSPVYMIGLTVCVPGLHVSFNCVLDLHRLFNCVCPRFVNLFNIV